MSVTSNANAPSAVGTGVVVAGVAVAGTAVTIFGDGTPGAEPSTREIFNVSGLVIVVAAPVFGVLAPRISGTAKAGPVGLALAIPAVLLVLPASWSGHPMVLGAVAEWLGLAARRSDLTPELGTAAVVIGALPILGRVVVFVGDWLSTNGVVR